MQFRYPRSRVGITVLWAALLLAANTKATSAPAEPKAGSTWPQGYSVQRDEAAGVLSLRTPWYTVEQDLRRGGAISRITLQYGKAKNLLVQPIESRVRDEAGSLLSDVNDTKATVTHRQQGRNEIVTVECALMDAQGQPSRLRVRSTLEYRWGYIKIRKEFLLPAGGVRLRELCPFATVLAPTLAHYGYREGISEEEGAPPFSFGSNRWGQLRQGEPSDQPLETRYVPRSMIFVDPGVEGLEWFVGSDLSAWETLNGRRGQGQCLLQPALNPPGLTLSVSPLWNKGGFVSLTNDCDFVFYVAVPLPEGHALKPWLHTSFNRNRGDWVSPEQVRRWAEEGIQTVHCHNDGDYYDDGLFWRDGSYPPYPDMQRYDQVLQDCRRQGIHTATYFSNKELHPSTKEFQEHGAAWGRMNRHGDLQHNIFRGKTEFGAQMCLRSGWLEFLKTSIDRVLKVHPLDGVYYDWNVALFCCNPLHEKRSTNETARGHWDIDELLDLMEWTRNRVGPNGLVIVHNTTTPMFAMENFADDVVATEWGYKKWTDRAPDLAELPLEWSLAGARSRGVISYGTLDSNAPRRLHRLFALEAFLGGVTPWPASSETFELMPLFKPLGQIESYRFADWRNRAISLSNPRCASAIYSRPDRAYLLLANLDPDSREVTCALHPDKLPYPLAHPVTAGIVGTNGSPSEARDLDFTRLIGEGVKLQVPGDNVLVIEVR
jgi:Domain of unknown function (DUF6259)